MSPANPPLENAYSCGIEKSMQKWIATNRHRKSKWFRCSTDSGAFDDPVVSCIESPGFDRGQVSQEKNGTNRLFKSLKWWNFQYTYFNHYIDSLWQGMRNMLLMMSRIFGSWFTHLRPIMSEVKSRVPLENYNDLTLSIRLVTVRWMALQLLCSIELSSGRT